MTVFQIIAFLSLYHAVHGYILLTADLEDVHAIARQIAASPVAGQLNKIIRRATGVFNRQASKPHKRSGDSDLDGSIERRVDASIEEGYQSEMADRRRNTEDVVALGKNATYYLQSIKKIFENV